MLSQSPQAQATERMLDEVESRLVASIADVLDVAPAMTNTPQALADIIEMVLVPAIYGRVIEMVDEAPVVAAAFGSAGRIMDTVRASVRRAVSRIPDRISDFRADKAIAPQLDAVARKLARWVVRTALFDAQEQLTPEYGAVFKRWVTVGDDRVRDQHAFLDGKRVVVGKPFITSAGAIMYPGDTTAPVELWINCRCHLEFMVAPDR